MKYMAMCGICQSTDLESLVNSKDDAVYFKCLNCDEDIEFNDIEFKELNEEKERCTACNGSGWYDACDKKGNPIPCGACSGTGFETD